MANRRNTGNRIRGPQSALTDFLASHNISANEIRQSHEARRNAARSTLREGEEEGAEGENAVQTNAEDEKGDHVSDQENVESARAKKRKRDSKEEETKESIKQNKKKAQRATRGKGGKKGKREDDDDDEEDSYDVFDMYATKAKSNPLPGQLDNCGKCEKRFTVTAYSKAGPDGRLLCAKCSKEVENDEKQNKSKKKKGPAGGYRRRQMQSEILDGRRPRGAKKLSQLCIEKVVANISDLEEFGDLPAPVINEMSKIFSKKRVIKSNTVDLFIRLEFDSIIIHDAADLATEDFLKMFAINPLVKTLELQNCGQFKNEVMDYITNNPAVNIVNLRLGGANLINDATWRAFLTTKGKHLKSLKLNYLDGTFDDETVKVMVESCHKLERLKLEVMGKITGVGLESLGSLPNLKHLTMKTRLPIESDTVARLLSSSVGSQLQTLCLDEFSWIDDGVLDAIHANCLQLSKIRLCKNSNFTDAAFEQLFTNWDNLPLNQVNFQQCRDVDASDAVGNEQGMGFCSKGFRAMMAHSGSRLQRLEITSDRHISNDALMDAFNGIKKYPFLHTMCISFCGDVDDTVLAGIFKSCPTLKRIKIFGCWKVQDPIVPRGVVLLGRPNAQDDIAIEGDGV